MSAQVAGLQAMVKRQASRVTMGDGAMSSMGMGGGVQGGCRLCKQLLCQVEGQLLWQLGLVKEMASTAIQCLLLLLLLLEEQPSVMLSSSLMVLLLLHMVLLPPRPGCMQRLLAMVQHLQQLPPGDVAVAKDGCILWGGKWAGAERGEISVFTCYSVP